MKYFRCSGVVVTDRPMNEVLFAAKDKEEAERLFESYVERFLVIEDLEIEEDPNPDELAVNE